MSRPGTPLPDDLTGELITRPVTIDRALLYLVAGSLSYLTDQEPLAQTGTLTVAQARAALSDMLWIFLTGDLPAMIYVGEVRPFAFSPLPSGWLICDGSAVSRTTYADLFALIGETYGEGDNSTTFNLPDLRGTVIVGTGTGGGYKSQSLGQYGGQDEVTLTVAQLPSHSHPPPDGADSYNTVVASGGNRAEISGTVRMSHVTTGLTGGDEPHNNMSPFLALSVGIYAGI